ncbi:hypothetical protein RHGRI_014324 [Rhododendron griersonianum]|uniref:Uncharacterized protein n=1 Tax=Rhododendron griersonianum TaxID=479676 RepID=A0AAV6K8X3_9ERIC|nr:hypothetical protein RHGRI_014324 [Rhododendron griersonianum]
MARVYCILTFIPQSLQIDCFLSLYNGSRSPPPRASPPPLPSAPSAHHRRRNPTQSPPPLSLPPSLGHRPPRHRPQLPAPTSKPPLISYLHAAVGGQEDLSRDLGTAPDDEGVELGDLLAELLQRHAVEAVDVAKAAKEVETAFSEFYFEQMVPSISSSSSFSSCSSLAASVLP